jgi:NAD(P)-dependent dehydrogenase (short-subunit alcohol dehydrogenase family)
VPDLNGTVAIITGSAGGIGASCALAMARAGAAVVIADKNAEGGEKFAAELVGQGLRAVAVETDVSDETSVQNVIAAAIDAFGSLDIVVNNAAELSHETMRGDRKVVDITQDVWDRIMSVNLRGYLFTTKHALPHMLEREAGVFINIASVAGLQGEHIRTGYAASKSAIIALTRSVAAQYGKQGIRAIAIAPGLIMTPAVDRLAKGNHLAIMKRHHLTPRLGRPDDIGAAAAFLASPSAGFITGVVLPVDGGFSSHSPTLADELDEELPTR